MDLNLSNKKKMENYESYKYLGVDINRICRGRELKRKK